MSSDGGGEYESNEFIAFYKQHEIKKKVTTRYTPQSNGVVERKNQTIMNMVRSMLTTKQLPNDYWAYTVACLVYILNRSPTSSVQGKVTQEAWSVRKVSVSYFKLFGCIAYAHIPKELRQKLDNISEKYLFVEYSEKSKAYRLYNPDTKKFLISRDVKFHEYRSWSEQEVCSNTN